MKALRYYDRGHIQIDDVPEPTLGNAPGTPFCTYLVAYEGEAEDLNAWHRHYFGNHTRHMARFPGIRDLEVYTRLDWVSALPCPRVNFMQRNKVVFDSADALTAALNSPIRHELRACFKTFPPFTGPVTDNTGVVRIKDGEAWGGDKMGNFDWYVEGVIGKAK